MGNNEWTIKGEYMCKNQAIQIAYEEWVLKRDSSPGWEIIPGIVAGIIGRTAPFSGWVYKYEEQCDQYVKVEEFSDENKQMYLGALNKFICQNALCLIRTIQSVSIEQLLSGYSKISSGVIEDNLRSQVFAAPIEMGDWAQIEEREMVLVIWHDGEPIFILKKPTN